MSAHTMPPGMGRPRIVRTRGGGVAAPSTPPVVEERSRGSRRSRAQGMEQGRQPAPPIKEPTFKWYIPLYFWLGGISAGSWMAATAESVAGENDRDLVRAGRYLAATTLLGGTALLVLDLGRSDRFLNMLRIVRARSAMSLGSWGLTSFGALTGAAALLQAAEDGWLGRRPWLARASRGRAGQLTQLAGVPAALFVGSYTGVLLSSTSVPSWARRERLLGPLFLTSALSSGLAAVSGLLQMLGTARPASSQRLSRAEVAVLATELVLMRRSRARTRSLPSAQRESRGQALFRRAMVGAGMVMPLVMHAARLARAANEGVDDEAVYNCADAMTHERDHSTLWKSKRRRGGARARRRDAGLRSSVASAVATLAGSLALRFLITQEGRRSARLAADTWELSRLAGYAPAEMRAGREERNVPAVRRRRPRRRTLPRGQVRGVITVVQEDRIRLVTREGRGYLFTVGKRRATLQELEQWRDTRVPVRVRYNGLPDAGAWAEHIAPA